MIAIYVGKKIPKGFEELSRSIHLGKGIWMCNIKSKEKSNEKISINRKNK